mgnify:CR=1 FL=1|jgi:N-acetylglucosamine malate deacetylase 1
MKVMVIAPHPDDETLGCGGTLLRHANEGDTLHWLIVTDASTDGGYSDEVITFQQDQINKIATAYGFTKTHKLGFSPARLDILPMSELVAAIGVVVNEVMPDIIYAPFRGDVHTDHTVVFDAMMSCTKWFRYPSIRQVLCYETLSETDFGLNPEGQKFTPNYFVNIAPYIDRKVEIAMMYTEEMGEFPFPRSEEALRSLARVRGVACGQNAAESFMLLKEILI